MQQELTDATVCCGGKLLPSDPGPGTQLPLFHFCFNHLWKILYTLCTVNIIILTPAEWL